MTKQNEPQADAIALDCYSACFHFEPTQSVWSDSDVEDFVELMLTGGCDLIKDVSSVSTLAQSKVRNIGEKSGSPIDKVAWLVAKKLTCRVCGNVDFATQGTRRVHETECKKLKAANDKRERMERVNARIHARYAE